MKCRNLFQGTVFCDLFSHSKRIRSYMLVGSFLHASSIGNHKSGVHNVALLSLQSPVFARPPEFKTAGGAIGVLPPLVKCGMERSTVCMGETNPLICARL